MALSGLRIRNLIRSAIRLDLLIATLRFFLVLRSNAFIYGVNCVNHPKMLSYVSIISYLCRVKKQTTMLQRRIRLLVMAAVTLLLTAAGEKRTTIFVIGDSTAANKDISKGKQERGWAMA